MKFLRAAVIALLLLCALAFALAMLALHNQTILVNAVLSHIEERTGYRIAAARSRLRFGVHLNVMLDRPSVRHAGRELITADRIRVIVSYHALIWNNGLPLRGITVTRPRIRMPASPLALEFTALPRLDNAAVQAMDGELRQFSGLAERLTIAEAQVSDEHGVLLLGDFSLSAAPKHRGSSIWTIGFLAPQIQSPFEGLHVSGRMIVNTAARGDGQIASSGKLWFWNGTLSQNAGYGTAVRGLIHGSLSYVLRSNGELDGSASIGVKGLELVGRKLTRKLDLGDYTLSTPYAISTQRVALAGIEARTQGKTVLSADATLTDPYASDATLLVHLGGARIDLAALKGSLGAVRNLPSRFAQAAAMVVAGDVLVEGVAYQTPLNKIGWKPHAILDDLTASIRLDSTRVKLAAAQSLPALSLDGQFAYSNRRVTLSQGSAIMGGSSFEDINGEIKLGPRLRRLPYRLALASRLDLGELYPALRAMFPALGKGAAGRIGRLSGVAPLRLTVAGAFNPAAPALPARYRASLETSGLSVAAKGLPQTISLNGGSAVLTPRAIELNRVVATAGGPGNPGNVTLDGSIDLNGRAPNLRRINVEMHQIRAQQWLPLLVDPNNVAASGPVGGSVTITARPGRGNRMRADGRLTMGAGQIQLGFLRSPIITESATLTLGGNGLLLAITGARLEGAPLDLSLGVANLDRPLLRIDANAGRLDLEVMRFMRVPWSKSPPAHFWPVPVVGHVVAHQASLERLHMSDVSCNFERKVNGDWRVYNFGANVYDGRAAMEFAGRGRDNWINIRGRADQLRVGPLFALAHPDEQAPLSGRMKATLDIWANANTDFFDTMAGTISVDLSDGVLHKFTLLSRVLSLINLKTWLSAHVPNPSINGVPFQTLTADFKGRNGTFYSDNLLLQGPVMNISASGNVHLGDGVVDMEVGMAPFKTVNWIVGHVPLIGQGLAENHLMAAYFKVSGPLGDPHVVPMPITSVAHFLGNVLKLPINVLKGVGRGVIGGGTGNDGGNGADGNGNSNIPISAPPAN